MFLKYFKSPTLQSSSRPPNGWNSCGPPKIGTPHLPTLVASEVRGLSLCSKCRSLESWATDASGATWAQWHLFILHRSRQGNGRELMRDAEVHDVSFSRGHSSSVRMISLSRNAFAGLLKGTGDKMGVDGQNLENSSWVWQFIVWSAVFQTFHVVHDGVRQTSTVPY